MGRERTGAPGVEKCRAAPTGYWRARGRDRASKEEPMAVTNGEKRRYERRPLFRPLSISRLGLRLATGRTINLSPAGACVIMRKPLRLAVDDTVQVEVDVPRRGPEGLQFEQVSTEARVRRIEDLGAEECIALEFLEEVDVV